MQNRRQHHPAVLGFLREHFPSQSWELSLPHGRGNETYVARSDQRVFFIKLGVPVARYKAVASIDLTPTVIAAGTLRDGTSILVQAYLPDRNPARQDYREHLEQFAEAIHCLHASPGVRQTLGKPSFADYRAAGLVALDCLEQKWGFYKTQVPEAADFVDQSLERLRRQVVEFQGGGLVASHNDICNANWILTPEGRLYLVDLEAMSLDDPALDVGATLWWYYPPELRERFLVRAGYPVEEGFRQRMQVRMAMHCLHILLPRPGSFDAFDPGSFIEDLVDFRAVLAGRENPQGYEDQGR